MGKILIIEDEEDIRELVSLNLSSAGLEVVEAADGLKGVEMALAEVPDLVVLDLMLPGLPGQEVFKQLQRHEETRGIPVIMLTARVQTDDRIAGLQLGADDYLTKPFSPKELVLRVEGLLRRSTVAGGGKQGDLEIEGFHLNYKRQRFTLNGEETDLTVTEFRLLALLLENHGKPLERAHLLQEVWGYGDNVNTRTLDTHVKRLREKLGDSGNRIRTERGVGYAFS